MGEQLARRAAAMGRSRAFVARATVRCLSSHYIGCSQLSIGSLTVSSCVIAADFHLDRSLQTANAPGIIGASDSIQYHCTAIYADLCASTLSSECLSPEIERKGHLSTQW